MTNTGASFDRVEIARAALARAAELAEAHEVDMRYGGWSDRDAGQRLLALYRRAAAWPAASTDPSRPFAVVADVSGPDDHVWGYVASDLLDWAGQDLPDSALISELSPGRWQLAWS